MDVAIDGMHLLLVSVGAAAAALLRAFTGFGFALAAVPVFSLLLEPSQVVVLTSSLALLLGLLSMGSWQGKLDKSEIFLLLAPAALGTVIGAMILPHLSLQLFQVGAGIAVLISSASLLIFRASEPHSSKSIASGVGLLSGLMNGALAIPGPPMIAYALLTKTDPKKSRALLTAFFTVSALFALMTFAAAGRVNQLTVAYTVAALPSLLLFNWLGNHLFDRYGGRFYRLIATWALVLMAVTIVYRAL